MEGRWGSLTDVGLIGKWKNSERVVRIRTQGRPISTALMFGTTFAIGILPTNMVGMNNKKTAKEKCHE